MTLTLSKMQLAKFLLTPPSQRKVTLKEFAENELKVSEQTLHRWKNDPEVNDFMKSLIPDDFLYELPDVLQKMKELALVGDMKAARIFLEYVGVSLTKIPTLKQQKRMRRR